MFKATTNFLDSLIVFISGSLVFVWLYLALGPNGRREFRLFLDDLEAMQTGKHGDAQRPAESHLPEGYS